MTPKRPHYIRWVGAMLPDGRPARHLENYGLPSRDMDAAETDALTQEQISLARANPDLFSLVDKPAPKAKTTRKAATTQPDAPQASEPTDAGIETDTAAEPATEGEG